MSRAAEQQAIAGITDLAAISLASGIQHVGCLGGVIHKANSTSGVIRAWGAISIGVTTGGRFLQILEVYAISLS